MHTCTLEITHPSFNLFLLCAHLYSIKAYNHIVLKYTNITLSLPTNASISFCTTCANSVAAISGRTAANKEARITSGLKTATYTEISNPTSKGALNSSAELILDLFQKSRRFSLCKPLGKVNVSTLAAEKETSDTGEHAWLQTRVRMTVPGAHLQPACLLHPQKWFFDFRLMKSLSVTPLSVANLVAAQKQR